MFLDLTAGGDPWGGGSDMCHGCKGLLLPSQPVEILVFDGGADEELRAFNGRYHAACARPLIGLVRALIALQRTA